MKNALLIFICLTGFFSNAFAQKYDYQWIMGLGGGPGATYIGNFTVFFSDTSADTLSHDRGVQMDRTQTTISDSAGDLLFYTNGMGVFNRIDSIMQNGDSINYGLFWEAQGGDARAGYPVLQGIIGLPTDSPNIWNLFHSYVTVDTSNIGAYPWRIDQTRVDMNGDNGLGKVVFKNQPIIQDTLPYYTAACRHANGRDWWLLSNKCSTDCLYEFLVQSDTIISYGTQCLGGKYISGDGGQAAFSPDGTKFAWDGYESGACLFDFDRCSGQLSNPIFLPIFSTLDTSISDTTPEVFQTGLAFSPDSRFLYVAQSTWLMQFDTQADSIFKSIDTVGKYTPPPSDTIPPGTFFLLELAPNGKIYVSANNGIQYLHVINEPDKKGDSCDFVNYGFRLPRENTFGIPNYPNYRLGAIPGSPCDTISGLNELVRAAKEQIIKIYPNPATDYAIIDYGFTDWNKGQPNLEICNALGQVVYTQTLPMYSGFQKIEVSNLASGIYPVFIKRTGAMVASGKLVIAR